MINSLKYRQKISLDSYNCSWWFGKKAHCPHYPFHTADKIRLLCVAYAQPSPHNLDQCENCIDNNWLPQLEANKKQKTRKNLYENAITASMGANRWIAYCEWNGKRNTIIGSDWFLDLGYYFVCKYKSGFNFCSYPNGSCFNRYKTAQNHWFAYSIRLFSAIELD